jgi:hypothetical protein
MPTLILIGEPNDVYFLASVNTVGTPDPQLAANFAVVGLNRREDLGRLFNVIGMNRQTCERQPACLGDGDSGVRAPLPVGIP